MTTRLHPSVVVVAVVVALCSAGLIGWTLSGRSAPVAGTLGPRLDIAVVPPVERDVEPGATMEVGELSDGFDRAMLERSAAREDGFALPQDAYAGDAWLTEQTPRMPLPTLVDRPMAPSGPPRPEGEPLRDGSRAFGFDRPRDDFEVERAARRTALDAPNRAALDGGTQEQVPPTTTHEPDHYTILVEYSSE
jgi:hypothetical protein